MKKLALLALVPCLSMFVGCKSVDDHSKWCETSEWKDEDGNKFVMYTSPHGTVLGIVTKDGAVSVGGSGRNLGSASSSSPNPGNGVK